ncbi:MAG: vitamin B12-dependent ribonucleotide reductase [bacterium]|nr:vitamin B12-dependent ribonucleotide reductase [bacterium]
MSLETNLKLLPNAIKVLEKRYLKKDENGVVIETPEMMFRRVAKNIASADLLYDKNTDVKKTEELFYRTMTNLDFIPNSPTLMNAGRKLQQLSACFVLPIEDSMESIFETIKNTALIHKSGGGTGFSFSKLRPKNDTVQTTKGVSSGPLSFMTVFNAATEAVKQGGTRRGANMGIIRVDHPDVLDVIIAKDNHDILNNFNISIGLTEEFMEAMEKNASYNLVNPRTGQIAKSLEARKVFDLIVKMAWKNGEPGIIFLDRLNKDNPTPKIGAIESTNPCGEQPLLPYESCNLGSINLSNMVKNKEVDWDKLRQTIETAVHFLDNVIDMNKYPLEEIRKMTLGNRKIGLGIMGFADFLIMLEIPYNSEKALLLAEEIMKFITDKARETSCKLAETRGTFPNFRDSFYYTKDLKIRNACVTTIAPTGTISIIASCSSGIEPIFALSYIRNVMDNTELVETNNLFEKVAKKDNFYSPEFMKEIAKKGTIQGHSKVPKPIQEIFVTSHDISPKWHIRMQAAFQKHIDNAVSKTVNFPHDATEEKVAEAYLLAYKLGCKGVTIYRDGSRKLQVLHKGKKVVPQLDESHNLQPRSRPNITIGITEKVKIGCGNLYVTVNADKNGICEVFTSTGRYGGCPSQSEATGRLVSLALRSGIDVNSLIDQLKGIRCHSTLKKKANGGPANNINVLSCPDAIGKVVMHFIEGQGQLTPQEFLEKTTQVEAFMDLSCPDCGGLIETESGCIVCRNCGYSKCG